MVGGKPLYTAFALILVKVKVIFWKALASDAPPHTYIIYAQKTDWYLRVLACPSHETAVARDGLAVYTENSLENFVRISCSHQKVVRLFKKWYDFSESPTTFSHISCSRRCISCSHRRISYSHCCISCSHRKERPSRTREPLPPLAPWLRRISFCLRSIGGCVKIAKSLSQ